MQSKEIRAMPADKVQLIVKVVQKAQSSATCIGIKSNFIKIENVYN